MALDDLVSTESAVVAAATAAVFSPRTRGLMRQGAVLGVAGALKVGDVVTGAAQGVARGVRGGAENVAAAADEKADEAESEAPANGRRTSTSRRSGGTRRSRTAGRGTTSGSSAA